MAYWPDTGTGVDTQPARKPVQSPIRKYFTEGGIGQPPTVPGGDWFNQMTNEVLNVLEAAGIEPSKTDDDQLLMAIKMLSKEKSTREALRRTLSASGFYLVDGNFGSGFTLTHAGDVVLDDDTGLVFSGATGSYPPGTPTTGFFDMSRVIGGPGGMTLNELQSADLPMGTLLGVKGRGDAIFSIELGTVYDGYITLPAGPLKVARLKFGNIVKAEWCGATSNDSGVLETETTSALNAMFGLAKDNAGVAFSLDGKYYTNGDLVIPLTINKAVYPIGFLSLVGNNSIIVHSHEGDGLRIETGSDIGNRNYAPLVQDIHIMKRGTRLKGKGVVVDGLFSPTFRRVICGNHDVSFENWCSSEVLFDKCVAYQCNIGIRGNQTSNPNGVNGNDFSVVTYNQFVCFGFEKHAIYSEGGGASIHLGGTIASPGLAARSAITYNGSFRSVSIDTVLVECQQLLSDGVFAFTGSGLKRAIYIKGVVQEVVDASAPSTLIRADGVESITLDSIPFNVQASSFATIKYAVIDGAKKVAINNCDRSESYLNKIELYDVDELSIDNLVVFGKNTDLQYRDSTGSPLAMRFDGAFSPTPVTDNTGKAGATCTQVMTTITKDEYNRILANKRPILAFAKIKTAGTSVTAILKTGNTSNGQITASSVKPNRWKTHLFQFPVADLSPTAESSCGVNFTGISAVSKIGFLSDTAIVSDRISVSPESVSGITGWPLYETIYNNSSDPGSPAAWVKTPAGIKGL